MCLTWFETCGVVLFQQGTNELQVGMDVLVDVRGPLVTPMEPSKKLNSRFQQHNVPGTAEWRTGK